MPGFHVYMFGSSPFPVPAAEVERGMSCILYHFDWFGLGCDLWPDGRNFGYVQCWCDRAHGLKFGRPRETEGGSSKVWSGNVGEKSLIVVNNEWLGQSGDLITHWWQLIIEGRREDWILLQFPSIILLYLSIWTSSIFLIDISKKNLHRTHTCKHLF